MAADHRYYKRQNFKNVAIEEYEVRDLFGRKAQSKLQINGCELHYIDEKKKISFSASVSNISDVLEPTYKVNVYITGFLIDNFKNVVISWSPLEEQIHKTVLFKKFKLTSVGDNTLFPHEYMDMCRFDIECPYGFSDDVLKGTTIEIRLYNQYGEQDIYATSMYDALIRK